MTTPPAPTFLTSYQVADRYGVSARWVRRAAKEGRIPAVDVSHGTGRARYRFNPDDLARWEQSRTRADLPRAS